ncbi:MAG: hypothetical protein Q8K45_10860 [Rubrivivax sp.]|nr:hypothetical protein [Rubrivivax sp.]
MTAVLAQGLVPTLTTGFDTVLRTALLGVVFRDAATLRSVADGLRAEVVDTWQPQRRVALAANRSGVFVLHRFPGLPGFGDMASPPAPTSPAEPARHRLEVRDTAGRYLPAAMPVTLPHEGLFGLPGSFDSPADTTPCVPLFSAATRSVPPPLAELRAELRRASDPEAPVPWALLELWLGPLRIAQGLADAEGRVLLPFPLPRPREPGLRDSPGTLDERWSWELTLLAFWSPTSPVSPPDDEATALPELEALLAQPPIALLQQRSPPLPLAPLRLHAGVPLLARSAGASFLFVAD